MYQELEIVLSDSSLSAVSVFFHTFCMDDNISFSQALASASQFYTPADCMYQEVEIIRNVSILSQQCSIYFVKDDISFSQAQASASQFYTPAQSMYQEVEIILNDSILSAVPVLLHTFSKDDNISFFQSQASASLF